MTKWRPAGHRVRVQIDKLEEVSSGGIIIARNDKGVREQSGVETGILVAIGPTAWKAFDDGRPWAKVGDRVKIVKYSGNNDDETFKETGIMYRTVNDDDIIEVEDNE